MSMRPKQWLHKNGHIDNPNQRGRLSREHIALIEKAVREGAKIDGYGASTDTPAEGGEVKVERVSTDPNRIADIGEPRRPETSWKAHTMVDGTKVPVGMRTVCNLCRSSLTYCGCRSPYVNVMDREDTERQGLVIFTMGTFPSPKMR